MKAKYKGFNINIEQGEKTRRYKVHILYHKFKPTGEIYESPHEAVMACKNLIDRYLEHEYVNRAN